MPDRSQRRPSPRMLRLLDGLVRLDLSHGIRGPGKRFRLDLYLDAIL